jgi:RNA polymerase primary sigma factor
MAKQGAQLQTTQKSEPDEAVEEMDEDLISDADVEAELQTEASKAQLERARTDAEKALKELERQGAGDSTLSRYFREMASHRVLTPQEEIEAAQLVERLEIEYWVALFSYVPCYETVAAVIERHLEAPPPEVLALRKMAKTAKATKLGKKPQEKWDETAKALATKMRELDSDRIFVQQSDRAVHRLAGEFAEERDIVGEEVRITKAFEQYLIAVGRARRGQQRSKNRFVAANLRLVVSIARRYNRGRLPLIDLIQEGNIGLMKAVERFDHNRGYRFSTYASWWIRHAISRALADKGRAVRIPVHMLDTYNRVARATQAIATRTGKEPTPEELEKETGIAADKLEKIKGYWAETPFSLDRPVNDEDGRKFIDFLEQENVPTPYEQLVSQKWNDEVRRLLETLTPMEARILRWRFGLDDEDELTLKEIGDKYNLSRERIRQLQEQALGKIRRQIKE